MKQPTTTAAMPPLTLAPSTANRPGLVRFFPCLSLHPLTGRGPMLMGRSADAQVVLSDPRASREHAVLKRMAGGLVVKPLRARHGVFVDGQKVEGDHPLVDGSVLRCGSEIFIFREALPELASQPASDEAGVGSVWHARSVAQVEDAARRGFDLLLLGDTGTGKDVLARHFARTARPGGPFVALNLAAISRQLFESELFGHARGAFTGAHEGRMGAFRQAHDGVLFLDEVGALAPEHHFKLHRVLEQHSVRPTGTDRDIPIDVLVVSATERRLDELCRRGEFETSLYQRLRRAEVRLRPLRERAEDLPALAAQVLARALGVDVSAEELHPEFVELLALQGWPGNVRQLQNALDSNADALANLAHPDLARLREALAKDPGRGDHPTSLLAEGDAPAMEAGDRDTLEELLHADERRHLRSALEAVQGNKTQAARRLGISRQHLHRRLRQLGLTAPKEPADEGESCT